LDPPTTPAATSYLIFATTPLSIDISSPGFQQVPACGYYLVETFTWTIPADSGITQDTDGGSNYKLKVDSTTPAHDGTYTVKLELSALYATLVATFTQEISFTVTVTDPCLTTAIAPFTLSAMSMQAGQTIE